MQLYQLWPNASQRPGDDKFEGDYRWTRAANRNGQATRSEPEPRRRSRRSGLGRRWSLLVFAVATLSLLVGGCGGGSATSAVAPTFAPTIEGSSPAATTLTPAARAELRLSGISPIRSFDPATVDDANTAGYVVEIFGGLITLDQDLRVIGDLAEKWEVSPDGTTYTFHLRKSAKFQSGRAVTAADVKYSIERASDPALKSPTTSTLLGDIVGVKEKLAGSATSVRGVVVRDDSTIAVTIDTPKSYFLAKLAAPTSFVVDHEQIEAEPRDWVLHPNATGPFKLAEFVPSEKIVLETNPNYHLGVPALGRVTFDLATTGSLAKYQANELDITGMPSPTAEQRRAYGSEIHESALLVTNYIGFNTTIAPFDDIRVRQAFSMTVDRAAHSAATGLPEAKGILPPSLPGYNPSLPAIPYDAARARQLLGESKYRGTLPKITLSIYPGFGRSDQAETLAASWRRDLGVTVDVVQARQFNPAAGGPQAILSGWLADYPDPENFLDALFWSKSGLNSTRYQNAQVDSLLESARIERDQEKRFSLYRQAEQIVVNEAPWAPLSHGYAYVLVKPWVRGYRLAATGIPYLRFLSVQR